MCNEACIIFVAKSLTRSDVEGKNIVELGIGAIGAKPLLISWRPSVYLGLNLAPGPEVDIVIPAERAADALGVERFDVVLATELLEHTRNWRAVVDSLKLLCKPGGRVIVTTRSIGYPFHSPPDYWRYTASDFQTIFSDFHECDIETDPIEPGVFISAVRPMNPAPPVDLSRVELYSITLGYRTNVIPRPLSRTTTAWTLFKKRARTILEIVRK